jgi:hypothetical protein
MAKSQSQDRITQLLLAWSDGDQAALEKLTPMVYAELHRLAKSYMVRERACQETAEVLKVSLRTVEREWNLARTWLYRELRGKDES